MPNEQEVFTEDGISTAYIFLNSIKLDLILRRKWQDLLESVKNDKSTSVQKVQNLDNFLTESGFDVSIKAVRYVLKTPQWKDYIASIKSNEASDKFVQQLLQDPKIFLQWNQGLSKTPLESTQLLKKLNANCNIQQVSASLIKMRHQNLTFWTDVYEKVLMTDQDVNKVEPGPVLIIYKDQVRVEPDTIFGWTYENGTLTWPLTSDKTLLPNNCSGSIIFSDVIYPKEKGGCTGKVFSGILDYSNNPKSSRKIYTYEGQVNDPINPVPKNSRPEPKGLILFVDISWIASFGIMLVSTIITASIGQSKTKQLEKYLKENKGLGELGKNTTIFNEKFKRDGNLLNKLQIETESQELQEKLAQDLVKSISLEENQAIQEEIDELVVKEELKNRSDKASEDQKLEEFEKTTDLVSEVV